MQKCGIDRPVNVLFDGFMPQLALLFSALEQPLSCASYEYLELSSVGVRCLLSDTQAFLTDHQLSQVEFLFVRSTTLVNQGLIQAMPSLRFVATATSGVDHLALEQLEKHAIHWCTAKGSNAHAVADYVVYALAALNKQSVQIQAGQAVVIGYGCVGHEVVSHLQALGCRAGIVDPFISRENQQACAHPFYPVLANDDKGDQCEAWLKTTSLLCIHTPLRDQPWSTRGWLNAARLAALPDGAVVVCAGRGETLDAAAMLANKSRLHFIVDVWPGEPYVCPRLVQGVAFASPHIAGHSKLGKLKGSWQVFEQFCQWLAVDCSLNRESFEQAIAVQYDQDDGRGFYSQDLPVAPQGLVECASVLNQTLEQEVLQANAHLLLAVSQEMKALMNVSLSTDTIAKLFRGLRQRYYQHCEIAWSLSTT